MQATRVAAAVLLLAALCATVAQASSSPARSLLQSGTSCPNQIPACTPRRCTTRTVDGVKDRYVCLRCKAGYVPVLSSNRQSIIQCSELLHPHTAVLQPAACSSARVRMAACMHVTRSVSARSPAMHAPRLTALLPPAFCCPRTQSALLARLSPVAPARPAQRAPTAPAATRGRQTPLTTVARPSAATLATQLA